MRQRPIIGADGQFFNQQSERGESKVWSVERLVPNRITTNSSNHIGSQCVQVGTRTCSTWIFKQVELIRWLSLNKNQRRTLKTAYLQESESIIAPKEKCSRVMFLHLLKFRTTYRTRSQRSTPIMVSRVTSKMTSRMTSKMMPRTVSSLSLRLRGTCLMTHFYGHLSGTTLLFRVMGQFFRLNRHLQYCITEQQTKQ